MTFKDLRKRVSLKTIHQSLYDRLKNKPFWIWDQQQHKKIDIEAKWRLLLQSYHWATT
ncbi:MAG: hypothetical protein WCA39_04150 [Nitrososphaeraceae archaeon]